MFEAFSTVSRFMGFLMWEFWRWFVGLRFRIVFAGGGVGSGLFRKGWEWRRGVFGWMGVGQDFGGLIENYITEVEW